MPILAQEFNSDVMSHLVYFAAILSFFNCIVSVQIVDFDRISCYFW